MDPCQFHYHYCCWLKSGCTQHEDMRSMSVSHWQWFQKLLNYIIWRHLEPPNWILFNNIMSPVSDRSDSSSIQDTFNWNHLSWLAIKVAWYQYRIYQVRVTHTVCWSKPEDKVIVWQGMCVSVGECVRACACVNVCVAWSHLKHKQRIPPMSHPTIMGATPWRLHTRHHHLHIKNKPLKEENSHAEIWQITHGNQCSRHLMPRNLFNMWRLLLSGFVHLVRRPRRRRGGEDMNVCVIIN